MVNSGFDQLVAEIRTTASSWHDARRTLEALDRVLIQRVFALRDARSPSASITRARGSGDAVGMASAAHRGVDARSIRRHRESRCSAAADGSNGQRRVVLARDGNAARREVTFDGSDVFRFDLEVRPLGVFTHYSR